MAAVLVSDEVLEDDVILSVAQVHRRPHSFLQLLFLGGVSGEQFGDGFQQSQHVLFELLCNLGQNLMVIEPEDE